MTLTADGSSTLDFTLPVGTELDEVVVSSSKRPEKLTESPATIETVYAREILEYAGNPAELIARQKGIDYFRAGIATPAFNIRGFNSKRPGISRHQDTAIDVSRCAIGSF